MYTQLKAQDDRLHFSRVLSSFDSNSSPAASKAAELCRRSRQGAGNCRARPVRCALTAHCPVLLVTQCVKPSVLIFSPAVWFFWMAKSGGSLLSYRVGTVRRGFFLEDPSYRRKIRAEVVGG